MKRKSIYIISATYPFGKGEEFVRKELIELSKHYDEIFLFPLKGSGEQRSIPQNVKLNLSLLKTSRFVPKKNFFLQAYLLFRISLLEVIKSDKRIYFLSHFRTHANSILQAKILSEVFIKEIKKLDSTTIFYSVWMDDGALLLSILHFEKKVKKITFRLHGYDLFDERRPGNYMPFRCFNFKQAFKIFILSKAGYDYLKTKNLYSKKLLVNYSGLYDYGINTLTASAKFTIVSCSNVIQIKRIDKIIESLMLLDFPVKWVHFGDGEKMGEIKKMASLLPTTIEYELKGYVKNESIIAYYQKESVNLFLHLSDTEGLGMAIVEAQSFGIPAIATNVGGVKEVVHNQTGVLISATDSPESVAQEIKRFKTSDMNTIDFRDNVKMQWKGKFDAEKNYKYFYEKLME